ncbi:MAG: SxtJ family membrane protein [Thermodesulfovibrionia bacterium]|nr:SxtJ family membrane protein [Thermodesulfovibrionia bacterium]
MLKEDIKNIRSETTDLRKFGLTVGIVFGIFGGLLFWRGKDYYVYFLTLAACLILSGLLAPAILKPIQKAWMGMAVTMGWFMTRVILAILYFLVFTPIRLIAGLFGKHFLDKKFHTDAESYWITKEQTTLEKNRYEKQF